MVVVGRKKRKKRKKMVITQQTAVHKLVTEMIIQWLIYY